MPRFKPIALINPRNPNQNRSDPSNVSQHPLGNMRFVKLSPNHTHPRHTSPNIQRTYSSWLAPDYFTTTLTVHPPVRMGARSSNSPNTSRRM